MAAVQALQVGSTLTEDSVIATVKHFPGAGAQTDGVDGTPLAFRVREKLKEKLLAKEGAQ